MSPEPRPDPLERALSPVVGAPPPEPEEGMALCLSGGGYRAMLFHLGAVWRLNEAALLPRLDLISSVSGGSITAAALGRSWSALEFDASGVAARFQPAVADPLRALAGTTIGVPSVVGGLFTPGSISDKVADEYRRHLLGDATLQDLPDHPGFLLNATSLQSGGLWSFRKTYQGDERVGRIPSPGTELAVVVAASSAFPPFLSPAILRLEEADYAPGSGTDLTGPAYRTRAVLADGGVFDNLGLDTAWRLSRTILVSDGAHALDPVPAPSRDWLSQLVRVAEIENAVVTDLRKGQVIGSLATGRREGTYWGIRGHVADYGLADPLPCPPERTAELASVPTGLEALPPPLQERLIDWGYAICDTALRRHVDPTLPKGSFPYPVGVG